MLTLTFVLRLPRVRPSQRTWLGRPVVQRRPVARPYAQAGSGNHIPTSLRPSPQSELKSNTNPKSSPSATDSPTASSLSRATSKGSEGSLFL